GRHAPGGSALHGPAYQSFAAQVEKQLRGGGQDRKAGEVEERGERRINRRCHEQPPWVLDAAGLLPDGVIDLVCVAAPDFVLDSANARKVTLAGSCELPFGQQPWCSIRLRQAVPPFGFAKKSQDDQGQGACGPGDESRVERRRRLVAQETRGVEPFPRYEIG